jgi:heme exporter protein B
MNPGNLWQATRAIVRREAQSELRNRQALNAVALFAVCSVVAVSLGLGPLNRSAELPLIHAALLWIILLFAAFTALARVFVVEEEQRTAAALRLAAPPHAVYLGKLLFNLMLLVGLAVLVALLTIVLLRMQVKNPSLFVVVLASGVLALVAGTTLVAAIIARSAARGALFAVLSLPILIPMLVTAVRGTALTLAGSGWDRVNYPVMTLIAYAVAMLVTSLFLFATVWES